MRSFWTIVGLFFVTACAQATLQGEEVTYKAGDTVLKGYLVYDNRIADRRPAVLVVHEWWGHNEYARKRARMLAKLGYTALAVDMYGDGKQADHPEHAGKFAGEVMKNMEAATARFQAGMRLLQEHKTVDPQKIAAIGYCFGGTIVLEMARLGTDLDGVVSFHGSLGTANPANPGQIKAEVLALNGAADPFVTAENIAQFKKEMEEAGVEYKFISYAGAKHGFTNPDADTFGKKFNMPLEYNAAADQQSWVEMQLFFKKIF